MFFTDPAQLFALFQQIEEENVFLIQNNQELETNLEQMRQGNALNLEILTGKLNDQKANRDRLSSQLKQGGKAGVHEQGPDTDSNQKLHIINNKLEKKIENTYFGVFKINEKKDTLEMLSKIEHLIQRLQENFKK